MSDNQNLEKKFVGYEYKRVTVPKGLVGLWCDSMRPFGWTLDKQEPAVVKQLWGPLRVMIAPLAVFGGKCKEAVVDHDSSTHEELIFKRDKDIPGKAELNRIQSQFENSARSIESLENSKTTGASISAYTIGLIGTAFIAFSTFAFLASMTPAFIVAAVPGFLGWIIPFFAYRAIKNRRTQKIDPLIEAQHDNIYVICQKAAEISCVA